MVKQEDRQTVQARAGNRCEYCKAPQVITAYSFHVEHIKPKAKGGSDTLENYALACNPCNRAKGVHVAGIDPDTGQQVRLFNPRTDKWSRHFQIKDRIYINGKTPTGRTTVVVLRLNSLPQLRARRMWAELELFP